MADILRLDLSGVQGATDYDLLYQDEEEEDEGGEQMEEIDPLSDIYSPEDHLPPLKRILSHYTSEISEERQLCTRLIPDAVASCCSLGDFKMLVMVAMALAGDHYHVIRIGIVSVIPALMDGNGPGGDGEAATEKERELIEENQRQLAEIPIRMLTDAEQDVRRVSQTVIINLLTGDVPWKEMVLDCLFPVIKRCLGKDENYDLRMDSAVLISKLASLVKKDMFLKHFSPLLPTLALDTMFHVRKAFAISCGELCTVLGEDLTEEHVLPLFLKLCVDEVWGVRKACGDVFTEVSHACNLGTRYDKLTPSFLKLLHDDSRWVRKAAYQSLGTFISTFHIPACNDQSLEEQNENEASTLDPLIDSTLRDNSQLDSSTNATTTEDSDNRHPLPDSSGSFSNSSTPIHHHPSAQYGSNAETGTGTRGGELSSLESPIPKLRDEDESVSSEESKEKTEEERPQTGKLNFDGEKDEEPSKPGENEQSKPGEDADSCSSGGCVHSAVEGNADGCNAVLSKAEEDSGSVPCDDAKQVCGEGSGDTQVIRASSSPPGSSVGLATESESVEEEREESQLSDASPSSLNCQVEDAKPDSQSSSSSSSSSSPSPSNSSSGATAEDQISQLSSIGSNVRLRSSSAGASMRRVSVESGLSSRQREAVIGDMSEGKRRRWSLDRTHMYNNNLPQIRVFVHSTSGHVVEQDLSATSPTKKESEATAESAVPPQEQEVVGKDKDKGAESEGTAYNCTMDKSLAMEMTLYESEVETEEERANVENVSEEVGDTPYIEQEIVPDELMEIYLSMTEHNRVQTVDSDLLYYCAYSLPGVTVTLSRSHWGLLKPTFNYLAEDMQWKIRRVLAFSLHEMARILGEDITRRDILPVFEEYCTKDIDDVKIGALTHLAEFFELLPKKLQEFHLPKVLDGLMQLENQKNWRYRNTLAEQLLVMAEFFDWVFLYDHIYPVAILLSADKVSEVRNSANMLIGTLIQKFSEKSLEKCLSVLQRLRSSLSSNSSWLQRLMFVKQCDTFLLNRHITCELFANECLPTLLQLARDKVPNVRIAIAKLLKDSVMSTDYFQSDQNGTFSLESLQITLECLQHDADRDVKFFAGGEVTETPKLMGSSHQWYSQRMRSESHTSSEYQDASEYLDLDIGLASSSAQGEAEALYTSSDRRDDKLEEIDDSNVGAGEDDVSGVAFDDDNDLSNLESEKQDLTRSFASSSFTSDLVEADDVGSTGSSSNEAL